MKKLLATILALVMALSLCTIGWADVTTVKDETELKNAVANGGEIKLAKSISLTETMEVKGGKSVVIDMNGYDITATSSAAFKIENGSLRITGNGTVSGGTGSDYKLVYLLGSKESSAANYSTLTVDENVTVKCTDGYAVMISSNEGCAYGVVINIAGKLEAHYGGLYVNGMIKCLEGNVPVISTTASSIIKSEGVGIYAAGFAKWTLNGNIDATGGEAVSVKSGIFEIAGGKYKASGEYADPAVANGNGTEETGAAISITSNDGYAKKIQVTISGGTFESVNGNALYEGIAKNGDVSAAAKSFATVSVTDGTFNGNEQKEAIAITTADNKAVISGGTFSNSVSSYVVSGLNYEAVNGDGYTYHSTMNAAVAAAGDNGDVNVADSAGEQKGTFTVEYNDGTGKTVRIYTTTHNPELPTMTRDGYKFKGWTVNGGTTVYTDFSTYEFTNDGATLTAVWSANSYYYYAPTTTDTKTDSPKTFDAGVGIYAVTALLSVTGMAWAGKKRH
jgi:uncharacterized repeat protein (TIGR02543 family)